MKRKALVVLLSCAVGLSVTPVYGKADLGREVLAENDGWAAYSTGTTGGSAAEENQVFTVTNRAELIKALGGDNSTNRENDSHKIIYVEGTIDINTDDSGKTLGRDDYKDPEFDFDQYLAAYSPEVWGYEKEVEGPLEDARKRSSGNQKKHIVINIGSNTTLIGKGDDAKIVGGAFLVKNVDNVIIRNIEFVAPLDYFPQWDPTDGDTGAWNSEYDGLTIENSTHVWVDHNTFGDGDTPDSSTGSYFGKEFQQHDGLLDVKNAADYVTISYNVFQDHDKTSIIGSSDSSKVDDGHLKVTLHHNYYKNVSQRLPRVRFGEVHVYNNLYEFNDASEYDFSYALGVGYKSKIYAENNMFVFDFEADKSRIINDYKGTSIYENNSYVVTPSRKGYVDLVQEFNANNELQLNENVGWTPTLRGKLDRAHSLIGLVKMKAGAGQLK
ncbi:pectate lyase family protein [Paenibacillus turpanensis]|uniref:pectate lyase family protein n=1 Tax=Paenibacillus turpanensis TaxID=2689078 RepID=UPI001FB6B801|nr:pectate lyase [Paenibacillus turpanensis]